MIKNIDNTIAVKDEYLESPILGGMALKGFRRLIGTEKIKAFSGIGIKHDRDIDAAKNILAEDLWQTA